MMPSWKSVLSFWWVQYTLVQVLLPMQIPNHPDLVLVPYHLHPVTLPQQYQSIVAYTCLN